MLLLRYYWREWIRVAPLRCTSSSTAQPVAWQPPLCWRTRCHYSNRHLLSSIHPLFLSSSVFPWCPSPCPSHYRMAFDYCDTSALCPACWHSRTPFGLGGVRVPCLCSSEVIVTLSLPSIRRANTGKVPDTGWTYPDGRLTILVRVCQSVSLLKGDDASNKVCIGRARAFPRIQTGHATFTASGFPVLIGR